MIIGLFLGFIIGACTIGLSIVDDEEDPIDGD